MASATDHFNGTDSFLAPIIVNTITYSLGSASDKIVVGVSRWRCHLDFNLLSRRGRRTWR